ncbi:TrkH family potassium uptake protein [Candidatus Acetothermia bacterium]|jgi:trk system potassium uptake protein TrkH|nr:TrkH family potassium uptake protein [Candidatus Acetothermia bacterium]MCI2427509.1 TrkH family potassium uptake protein [Candidatus Acetothermia bacterium]MCI2428124.1 TrkH family potassium uptake protein [Candidatus Acetothermia bacterium]
MSIIPVYVRSDLQIILRDLGRLLPVVGIMAIISMVIALFFTEYHTLIPLLITAGVSFALGAALYFPCRIAGDTKLKHGMVIAAFGWLLIAVIGSLPFILIASFSAQNCDTLLHFRNPLTAFFEAISGFTGTGLTMAIRPDLLPRTLQWWRSFSEWVGGMGVIVLMLTLLAGSRPGVGTHSLYYAEARGEKIQPSIISTLRTMWWIYLLYTFISIAILWGAGMPVWEALNHAMTAISTGGFTITDNNIAYYNDITIELALMPIMLFGAISFAVHYILLRGNGMILGRDFQTRWLLIILVGGIILLTLEKSFTMSSDSALRQSAFQFISAITCTGFQTAEIGLWSTTAQLLLVGGMFIGGAAGSTAGGIKIMRMLIMVKGVQWRLRKIIAPRKAIVPFRIGSTKIDEADAGHRLEDASLIIFLWMIFLVVGVFVLLQTVPPHFTLSKVIFEVVSAQSNVGLTTGITHPEMASLSKLMLSFNMWIGRLEIIPVLMLIRTFFLRRID